MRWWPFGKKNEYSDADWVEPIPLVTLQAKILTDEEHSELQAQNDCPIEATEEKEEDPPDVGTQFQHLMDIDDLWVTVSDIDYLWWDAQSNKGKLRMKRGAEWSLDEKWFDALNDFMKSRGYKLPPCHDATPVQESMPVFPQTGH